MNARATVVALAAIATVLASGCGIESTEQNEVGLIYGGGIVEEKEYKGVLDAGSTNSVVGFGDAVYRYRTDQRSWVGRTADGSDRDEIEFVSKDGVRMRAPFEVYFSVNQEPEIIQAFHENIGIKTSAWTPDGWTEMLRTYFDPPLERAIDSAGLGHEWRPLREDEEVRSQFAADAARRFKRNLDEIVGGNYFCGPDYQQPGDECGEVQFTLGQPSPVEGNIVRAIESEQTAAAETQAQEQVSRRNEAEADARQVLIDQLGPDAFACLEIARMAVNAQQPPPPCTASVVTGR